MVDRDPPSSILSDIALLDRSPFAPIADLKQKRRFAA